MSTVTRPTPPSALLRARDVALYLGVARPSVYRLIRLADFPRPLRLHGRIVAWDRGEIDQWLASRPRAGRETSRHDNAPAGTGASISAQ